MEIERKWMIDRTKLTFRPEELPSQKIEQCYVCFSPVIRIRKINEGERYILTVKSPREGIAREEFELPLTKEEYETLYEKREGNVIRKTRYIKKEGNLNWEIDFFEGDLEGLSYMEIEFPSEEEARDYPIPGFATADVSDDPRYANAGLAQFGKPDC